MTNLLVLIPVALFLGAIGLGAFIWALRFWSVRRSRRRRHADPQRRRRQAGLIQIKYALAVPTYPPSGRK